MANNTKLKVKVDVEKLANLLGDLRYKAGNADYYREQYERVNKTHEECPSKADYAHYKGRCADLERLPANNTSLSSMAPCKIPAIKLLRTKCPGLSIKEAKDAVEALVGVANLVEPIIGSEGYWKAMMEITYMAYHGETKD